jgi:hypothetical protein
MRPPYKEDHSAAWDSYTSTPAPDTDYFSSLQTTDPIQKASVPTRKIARYNKFRTAPSLVHAYRPLAGSGTTRHKKQLRPKQEPVSPVMSGYSVCLCLDVHWSLLTSFCSTLPAMEITTTPHQLPTKLLRQYRNTHNLRSISTMHSMSATHHSHTTLSRTTMFSRFKLLPLATSNHKPYQGTRTLNGTPTPITSTSP